MKSGYKISLVLKFIFIFIATDLSSARIIQFPNFRRASRIARIPSSFQVSTGLNFADADTVNLAGPSLGGLSMIGVGGIPGHGGLFGGTVGVQSHGLGLRSPFGMRGVATSPFLVASSDTPDYPSFDSPDYVVARSGSLADLTRAAHLQSLTDADNVVIG